MKLGKLVNIQELCSEFSPHGSQFDSLHEPITRTIFPNTVSHSSARTFTVFLLLFSSAFDLFSGEINA